mgnify:FL=1
MGVCCSFARKAENLGDPSQTHDETPKPEVVSPVARVLRHNIEVNEDSFAQLKTNSAIHQIYKRVRTTLTCKSTQIL